MDTKEFHKLTLTTGCGSCTFQGTGLEVSIPDKRLSYVYWTPKLHKSPIKNSFIAGSLKVLQDSC